MKCPRCQYENPPQAKFCLECGARVALTCTKCHSELPAGAKFCLECGEPVAPQATAQRRFSSPETYTPKHLAEKILTSKAALEGERKQVTVLFADLKGSMELLADRDPEEARKILDPVLERMMEAVHRYEGTVNQVMGDGIMALFGAPLAHEDHAVRACYAALRMQDSVRRYAEEAHRATGAPVHIRVGLNSGEVVVRSIGSDLRMDYTAVGQTTHLAARMEQMAMPGSTLATAATLRLSEGFVLVKPLGERIVKGLEAPVEVFEIVGAVAVRSRLHAAAARGLTRFVGRETELELLERNRERAERGQGQVVAIVGEPGLGKSRLFWEFTRSHRTTAWLLLEAGSVSYGKATPYLPVIDLLRGYFQVEAADGARKLREKVTGKLLALDRLLEPSLPAFLALLDVTPDDEEWARLDPAQRRRRTLDALKRLLLRESQVQPLLLVFEDLHWIDSETQALLDGLAESLPTARLLLLVNYRPEYQHGWSGKTYYTQLRIDPLPARSAEALLDGLVGDDPGVRLLKRHLIEHTEGNPFFLEESVQTLVETGVLTGERGAYRMTKDRAMAPVPPTVHAVLAARIDRLPHADKELLQTSAVIGKDVPFALLEAIVREREGDLRAALARLQAAEFLYETTLSPDLEYTFKHALTHEVAYGSMLQERRRTLHRRIVGAIEALYAERSTDHAEQLAHHALRAEAWPEAVGYLRQAAARAKARGANRQAVGDLDEALEALRHLPESRERMAHEIDVRLELEGALMTLGDFGRIAERLEQAEALAKLSDDRRRLGRVYSRMTYRLGSLGDFRGAIEKGAQALAIARDESDSRSQVSTRVVLARVHYALGEHERVIEHARRNEESVDRQPQGQLEFASVQNLAFSRVWWVLALAELGEFSEGAQRGEAALRAAETVHGPHQQVWASLGLGRLHLVQGELSRAVQVLERVLPLCEVGGEFTIYFSRVASSLGAAYALVGRTAEAVALLERAVSQAESIRFVYGHSLVVAHLGLAQLLAGGFATARGTAERALTLARRQGERGWEAWTLSLLGDVAAQGDAADLGGAETGYADARRLAEALGMRPLVAHCHLGLAKLYRRMGKEDHAREHLTTATTMYREMGMTYWLGRVEEES